MRRIVSFGPAFVVMLTAGVVLLAAPGAITRLSSAHTQARVALARQGLDESNVLERINASVRLIASSVEPSVVHIEIFGGTSGRGFFRGSTGSGWVYDDAGHIVTNAHVVSGANVVRVQFHDGRVQRAELVGADPLADVAVLRVPTGTHLVPMRRASGERPQVGDRVYAFGSPFGFKFSMSEGIVSGLGRSARGGSGFAGLSNFIQTDAAVNPGNSGGPLVDVRGRLVGMTVAIATARDTSGTTDEGQSAGIGFAIPLGTVESRVDQILQGEPVRSGFLGITFGSGETITDSMGQRGVPVLEVMPGGPADSAGLRAGDTILTIDGDVVFEGDILRSMIASRRPGERVALRVRRGDETVELTAVLGEQPRSQRVAQYRQLLVERVGLVLEEEGDQVRVRGVVDESPAAGAGVRVGERVFRVGEKEVASVDEAIEAFIDSGLFVGRGVKVSLWTMGSGEKAESTRTVTLRWSR